MWWKIVALIRYNGLYQLPPGYAANEPIQVNVFGHGIVAELQPGEVLEDQMQTAQTFDAGSVLLGMFIGAVFLAPFIWVPLGRRVVKESVRRGAKVTSAKVEKWIAKGEK